MRAFRTFLLCTAAMAFAGCDDGDGLVGTAPNVPLAFTRFVNVVADHGDQDWRFIDQIEYSPPAFGLNFRQFTPYQGTAPGDRPLRIFPTSSDIATTSQRLVDTTLTFQAGTYYTIVHLGLVGDGSNRVMVIQDDIPTDIAAGRFALRAMHFGTGWGNIDVYGATSTTAALPTTPLFAGVPFQAVEDYTTLDVGPVALRALPAGDVTALRVMANATAPAGDDGDAEENLTPIGGTSIGGSAMVGIFTAGSVPGSSAPQGSAFVTTTGSDTTVYATATGFARMTGSFRSNNFFLGQEVTGDAFSSGANNTTGVITAIQDFARTGSISLERTATGYVRSTGSFVTDGFTNGMEIYVTGFDSTSNNGLQTITAVTATELTVGVTTETEEAGTARSICANPCSTITVSGAATVAEAPNGLARVRGPRPGWVYIIDRHPR